MSRARAHSFMIIPETYEKCIEFLVSNRAIPVWGERISGKVYFRRLKGPGSKIEEIVYGTHIIGKESRIHMTKLLGINTREKCKEIRELVKKKIVRAW